MARAPGNPERSFGVSVGVVLLIIAAALWWRGRPLRAEVVGGIGATLLAAGLIYAPILKYPSAVWWRFARALGYVNARVLLTVLFALVLVPVSLLWRAIGKDPLSRRREKFPGWLPYPERYRDTSHYERMF
jgi:saxitoxin biosynthesis operon SxtJ-like protein